MSDADAEASTDDAGGPLPSLGKPFRSRPDAEMNTIGWTLFLGLLALLLPLLPVLVVVWVLSKLIGAVAGRGQGEEAGS